MFNVPLRVNQAGDPSLFDRSFFSVIQKSKWSHAPIPPAPPTLPPEADVDFNPPSNPSQLYLAGIEEGNFHGVSFMRSLRRACGGNPSKQKDWLQVIDQLVKSDPTVVTPTVNKRRRMTEARWNAFVNYRDPQLKWPDEYWTEKTVLKYWESFLVVLATRARGRSGDEGTTVRSTTVEQWGITFMYLIGRKLVNEQGETVGTKRLTQHGLWQKMKDRISWICRELSLARHPKQQVFIGRAEILLMLRKGFQESEEYGRIPFEQTAVALVLVFQIGVRMGSLGWSNTEYRDLGHYMKLEDIEIEREGDCLWSVTVTIKHRKGNNMTIDATNPLVFKLDPVTKVHNLWFDFGTHILVYLLMRQALEGCETLQDIIDYPYTKFKIKSDMKKDPLFVERSPKGQSLGAGAASAKGLTASFTRLGLSCDIPGVTGHGIRRDLGNKVGLIIGIEAAQVLLAHTEGRTTFHTHYSHNTLNLPVTQLALGELDHTASLPNQIALKRHGKSQLAAKALLLLSHPDTQDEVPQAATLRVKLTKEEEDQAKQDPEVVEVDADLAQYWAEYYSLMPDKTRQTHGQHDAETIHKAFATYKDDSKFQANQERLEELKSLIVTTGTKRNRLFEKAKRPIRDAKRRKALQAQAQEQIRTDDLSKAQGQVQELVKSAANLPDFNSEARALGSLDIKKPDFGLGLLSTACRQALRDPLLLNTLEQDQTKEQEVAEEQEEIEGDDEDDIWYESENQPEDTQAGEESSHAPPDGGNGIQLQTHKLTPFKDVDELEILDADLKQTKISFMEALYRPVVMEKVEQLIVKAHGGKWPCLLCLRLPPDMKSKVAGELFVNKVKLMRHLETHSDWFLLIRYMLTDNPSEFKCPSDECPHRASTIEEVQEHCLHDCSERHLFQTLKNAHDTRERPKEPPREALKRRKLEQALADGQVKLSELERKQVDIISNITAEDLVDMELEDLAPFAPTVAEFVENAQKGMSSEGIIVDAHPTETVNQIMNETLSEETQRRINQYVNEANKKNEGV